ncbi:TIGR02757 family protein [Polaribacter glomeratus]|uniref:TIGR02757 family protein n=1 Tax=Polaribacter glomeratus TaxID=102 RepID=A0A2S7WXB4_9FLAO|nr:TIGR02757 family protein [Polaribacter glomeratus]PQJ82218.1 TIGR02757 family protein [Polaribacter glomeratus]TXD66813.1 TIGR02757 family protein [Polaribacter glomeratus]
MKQKELKEFLDEKVILYNNPKFIESDPIQIPHQFSKKEDIEIAAFLTATISWGNRTMIIKNSYKMMELLDNSPHDFILNHQEKDLKAFQNFVHRTFNYIDFQQFIKSLQHVYLNHGGLENALAIKDKSTTYQTAIHQFKAVFFEVEHQQRTQKHISDPLKNSAAKRINMFLRWMVRNDKAGVDFGLWQTHNPANLSCPLDVHSGNVARKLKLLLRTQNDWKALSELDKNLRKLDKKDPVKYDFALFGLGVFEKF